MAYIQPGTGIQPDDAKVKNKKVVDCAFVATGIPVTRSIPVPGRPL